MSEQNEQPIITFGVTQRNLVMGFMVVVGGLSAGNFAINWKTQLDVAEIKAVLPINEKQFDELKASIEKNDAADKEKHEYFSTHIGDLEREVFPKHHNEGAQ
jgi:predicted lipase